MANWSELPHDVLRHLTSFLPIQDYHRFGAVCQNWSYVAKERCHPPALQLPWLAMGEEKDTKNRKFYNLLEDKHYYINVPELRGKVICGSSYGWLFTLDRKLNFHLINPLTKDCYDLPPPPPHFEGCFNRFEVTPYLEATSDDEEAHGRVRKCFEELQRVLLIKAILDYDPSKRSDFTAVIVYGQDHTPAFWKQGNNAWTIVTGMPNNLDDITFFKGKFFTVRHDDSYEWAVIYNFEAVGSNPVVTEVKPRVPLNGDPNYVMDWESNYFIAYYLVGFCGELLLVERFVQELEEVRTLTTKFVVHKLDLEGGNYSTCCHIDGHAIFLGASSSLVVSPNQNLKCTKDAIYFTDLESDHSELYGAEDLGIYDLVQNNFMPYYSRAVFHHTRAAPIWFTPNSW